LVLLQFQVAMAAAALVVAMVVNPQVLVVLADLQ
jgi:hypothetical protein